MKIEGEDIRKVADHAQGAGRTVEPMLRGASNVLGEVGHRLVHPMSRKARLVEFKEADYQNGEDWTAAEDGALTVNASVSGGTTIDLPEPIEFVHFGRVYRDRSPLFPCPKVDDTARTLIAPPNTPGAGSDIPAHGLMYRAALQRETVLLGGFIRAQMDALIAEEKSKGVIGVLATVLADLTGSGGGTKDKANAIDLNPHLKKVIEAGKKTNRPRVDYPTLHETGIMLHTARRAYREYLVTEAEKRHQPAKSNGGGILNEQVDEINEGLAAGHSWLGGKHDPNKPAAHDAVPKLTALVPPGVQDFLSVVQKISFKAWDVAAGLNYEYAIRLEPIIENACREMTVSSIRSRALPVFPVWFLEPQPEYQLPADVEQKIFDKIDNPLDKGTLPKPLGFVTEAINKAADIVTDPIKHELNYWDSQVGIDKTLDFLSRPDRYTPGRPFLDDIFLIPTDPDPPDVPDAARRARVGWSGGLGQMAVDVFKSALGVSDMPGFLEFVIAKISTVCAEFIRGVYCRLLTLKDTDHVSEAEILEAAKRHLVGNVIESILGAVSFVDGLRKVTLDIPIAEVAISTDALIGRAKEFAALNLEEFIDPVVKFAMRDLHGMIFAYRATAITNRALTMEVHLAQLPTVFARLFRNMFFPLWDKVLERAMEAVTASLAPRVLDAGRQLLKAREQVENVRGKIVQGLAALDTLPAALPDAAFSFKDPKGSVKKLKNDWNPIIKNAKEAWDSAEVEVTQDLPGLEADELEQAFPLARRLSKTEALPVTGRHLRLVKPALKWKRPQPPAKAGSEQGAAGEKAPSATENGAPGGSAPGAPTMMGPQQDAPKHYPYGDYPLQSQGTMYAQASQPGYAPYQASYAPQADFSDYGSDYGGYPPPSSHVAYAGHAPPSQGMQAAFAPDFSSAMADPPTADLPPSGDGSETTQQFGVSADLKQLANLDDVEQTVDIDHVSGAQLPPFLGPSKKA